MTGDDAGLKLRGARERLCAVQTYLGHEGGWLAEPLRVNLQEAIDRIDRVGVIIDPRWSVHNEPPIGDPDAG